MEGAPGSVSSRARIETLDFSGSDRSLSFPDALAHPDHCRMVLKRVDVVYFAASA